MLEIEAKIKVQSLDPVAQRLEAIGATFVAKQVQRDEYFVDAEGKLAAGGCGLRLRTQTADNQTHFILTFKGPRKKSCYKSRTEYETTVADGTAIGHILEGLGYRCCMTVTKTRQLWQLDTCRICLDTVLPLGFFVEVEGPSDAAVGAALSTLELAERPTITDGYAALLSRRMQAAQ